jgi:lipopolysaccharide export system protein LptC
MTLSAASWAHAPPAPTVAGRRERRRVFEAARRHSRLVRRLRVLLPAAGVVTVIAFLVATRIALPGNLDLAGASLSVTRNSIIMDNPHLTGFDADGREYTVGADRAVQPLLNPDRVRLEAIEASVLVPDQGTATITAEAGEYDNRTGLLDLQGAIVVDSSEGYALRMNAADVDLRGGTMTSNNPVSVRYQDSETTGQSLSVTEGGKIIVLQGGVRTTLMPPRRDEGAAEPPGSSQ